LERSERDSVATSNENMVFAKVTVVYTHCMHAKCALLK